MDLGVGSKGLGLDRAHMWRRNRGVRTVPCAHRIAKVTKIKCLPHICIQRVDHKMSKENYTALFNERLIESDQTFNTALSCYRMIASTEYKIQCRLNMVSSLI